LATTRQRGRSGMSCHGDCTEPCQHLKAIIMDKYPASFRYLPCDFNDGSSDNKVISEVGCHIYEEPFVILRPSDSALGLNAKCTKISTSIKFGEIYVIWAIGTTLYKIGVSKNFNRRYRDLTAASPLPLRVMHYARCDHPHLLEDHFHTKFAHRLFKNEWYSLDADDVEFMARVFDRYFEKAALPI